MNFSNKMYIVVAATLLTGAVKANGAEALVRPTEAAVPVAEVVVTRAELEAKITELAQQEGPEALAEKKALEELLAKLEVPAPVVVAAQE